MSTQTKVNKQNYTQYKYLRDYRNGGLESLTNEELDAQRFYIAGIYKGVKYPLKNLEKIAMRSIKIEKLRRKTK